MIADNAELDEHILTGITKLYEHYDSIEPKTKVKVNSIINTIYERNKELVNKFSNEDWIVSIVEAYKQSNNND